MEPPDSSPLTKRRRLEHEEYPSLVSDLESATTDDHTKNVSTQKNNNVSEIVKDCPPKVAPEHLGSTLETMASEIEAVLESAKKLIDGKKS